MDLACLADPLLVAPRIAAALGIRESPGRSAAEALVEVLAERAHLVVLDNCEHLVEAVAELAENLLVACGGLVLLATSREALHAEVRWLEPSADGDRILAVRERAAASAPQVVLVNDWRQLPRPDER